MLRRTKSRFLDVIWSLSSRSSLTNYLCFLWLLQNKSQPMAATVQCCVCISSIQLGHSVRRVNSEAVISEIKLKTVTLDYTPLVSCYSHVKFSFKVHSSMCWSTDSLYIYQYTTNNLYNGCVIFRCPSSWALVLCKLVHCQLLESLKQN